jgi:hypothetical protein
VPDAAATPWFFPPATEASASKDVSGEAVTPARVETHGISVANHSMAMTNADKMNKVAGLAGKTEKVLPGDADAAAPENNLPAVESHARIFPLNESSLVISGASAPGSQPVTSSGAEGTATSTVVDLHTRAVERTHDMVALHAMRLVDAKADSLSVVIKPGAGLQLALEMRQRGDAIDIRAVLQHGNFDRLSQRWPELQQRLEQRGIRLAPLAGGENSTAGGGADGFQQPQRGYAEADPLEASAFAAFALAGPALAPSTPATVPATVLHGWESWA